MKTLSKSIDEIVFRKLNSKMKGLSVQILLK
jgi:hypothetical protein